MRAPRLIVAIVLGLAVLSAAGLVLLVQPFDPVRVVVVQESLDHPWASR